MFGLLLVAVSAAAPAAVASAATPGSGLGVGDVAADFTLTDQDGRRHTVSAKRGKRAVVLVFYRGHW
ncbi:MAG: redoxin domain-containing protein [Burkholderiales bacterium]|nr:redoxin domain-containing protein [Burkholderiales bacterium]